MLKILGFKKLLHFTMKTTQNILHIWYVYNHPHIIKTSPQSPELYGIENLWVKLETEIRYHLISKKEEGLNKVLSEEWKRVSPQYTKEHPVESIPDRLKEGTVNKHCKQGTEKYRSY